MFRWWEPWKGKALDLVKINRDIHVEVASRHEADEKNQEGPADENHDAQPSSVVTGQTKCSICQSTFRRPEHLKRHFRSHTKEKPFECMQCGRHFSRT